LSEAFGASESINARGVALWGLSLLALTGVLASVLYFSGAPERQLKSLLAGGQYAAAAMLADRYLAQHPGDAQLTALGTDALLKAKVPEWLTLLQARRFDRASAVVAELMRLSAHNADARSLAGEIGWIGELEAFVIGRGGVDTPIRIYADEGRISAILGRWNEDPNGHQRAFDRIAYAIPEFRDRYADALSHLRKLQSDDSVYVAAIERLKTTISARLNDNRLDSLPAVLDDYAAKYPRLGGLERVRGDLSQYSKAENGTHTKRLGPLVALLRSAHFETPPFQERFRSAIATRLPSADVVRRYEGVSRAWREGNTDAALSDLQRMTRGPWGEAASNELAHKKALLEQFAQLQAARGTGEFNDRLALFYGALDPDEDAHFVRALGADIGAYRDKALSHAQELLDRAHSQWRQYQEHGGISGDQLSESGISNPFRAQARLLSAAWADAQEGARTYAQFNAQVPAQWKTMHDEIAAEADLQRRSLREQGTALPSALLKEKLALIGGPGGEERRSP
jgi:hypothetical protein